MASLYKAVVSLTAVIDGDGNCDKKTQLSVFTQNGRLHHALLVGNMCMRHDMASHLGWKYACRLSGALRYICPCHVYDVTAADTDVVCHSSPACCLVERCGSGVECRTLD